MWRKKLFRTCTRRFSCKKLTLMFTYSGQKSDLHYVVYTCRYHVYKNTVIYSIKRRGVYFFNRLKGGGVYSRVAPIRGRRLNIGQNKQYYAEFQVSTPWGLGRSWHAASNLSTVCGTYFGSSSQQIIHAKTNDKVAIYAHTEKKNIVTT